MAPFAKLLVLAATVVTVARGALLGRGVDRRQISTAELLGKYDFIIAGGGTCGLTIADRVTAAFPKKNVLVVEYGVIEYAPGVFDPPDTVWGATGAQASSWTLTSLPIPDVNNRTATVVIGKVVGGSSAINGMFFDRGSRHDFDAWARVGSPEFDSCPEKWDFEGLFPYFRKAVNFTAPPPEVVDEYNYTWDMAAYGGSTPIHSSFPPFLWADHSTARDAWSEMGITTNQECASGDKAGLCWVPLSQDPLTCRRSHAGLGHYADVNTTRPNYDLLVHHQVVRVIYPNGTMAGPPAVEIRSLDDGSLLNITATAEVIISAGALHTPIILHRSGIGPAGVLQSYNISVVLDLPGVGSNFHDHSGASISWNYTNATHFYPMPSDMLNATFVAEATAAFDEIPAQGPYTLAMSNSAIFVPLANLTNTNVSALITSKMRAMAADGSAASYLPPDYASDPTMRAGYAAQLLTLADFLDTPGAPSLESGFATGTAANAINVHPLSRGTVRLNATDPLAPPVLDYRTASNPVDWDVYLAHVRFLRRMVRTAALRQRYGAVEVGPGAAVADDDDDGLVSYIKTKMTFSFEHPCCTAAMLPCGKGGVVGPDLKVHGAAGLRVVDMSVLPFLPSSHLSQTAYAVAEKAADIIIKEWKDT